MLVFQLVERQEVLTGLWPPITQPDPVKLKGTPYWFLIRT